MPSAELPALQPCLTVRDQRVEEIFFRLIEKTKVATPGHIANDVYPRLPPLGRADLREIYAAVETSRTAALIQ
nr:MetaGeneMark_Unknown Function [uncultured bacterium]